MMSNTKTLILTSTYPTDISPPKSGHHHRVRHRMICILHVGGLLTSLVAISLFAAAIPKWNANFFHNTGPNTGDWTDGMPLAPLALALLYHAATLVHSRIARLRSSSRRTNDNPRQQRPSPSLSRRSIILHITLPTLVLASLLPSLLLAGYGSLFRVWRPAVRTQSGILVCNMLNVFAPECEPVLYSIGNLQIGGIVMGVLVWTVHFALLLDAARNMRRFRLVRQLQREKLAHYGDADHGRERSHRHRRKHSKRGSNGSGSQDGTSPASRPDHHRQDIPRSSGQNSTDPRLGSGPSRPGFPSGGTAGVVPEAGRGVPRGWTDTEGLAHPGVPVYFVRPPEQSHVRYTSAK
ncbi:hypothetical protein ABEF92_003820 [Exophiala dermatitidis]